jgi:sugar phosphate isomerase/epimerase
MRLSRRALLAAAVLAPMSKARAAGSAFGVAAFTYTARLARQPELRDPFAFLRFCRERGAGGVQIGIPARDEAYYAQLRRYLNETGCWLEGQVRLPRDASDVERFEADLRSARSAGAAVVRTVMLSGRRYETFATAEDYRRFKESSSRSMELAAGAAARGRMQLAVENHKDYRTEELLELLRRLGSEWVGVTVDTGNNVALLEEPLATVEALAPYAFAVHLKDMAVDAHPDGFLLAEVPFGTGFLDLRKIVDALRKRRPSIRFNIEMATRNPLVVPCLTDKYWATLPDFPAPQLARTLGLVRDRKEGRPLPRTDGLAQEPLLDLEDRNARACLQSAGALT